MLCSCLVRTGQNFFSGLAKSLVAQASCAGSCGFDLDSGSYECIQIQSYGCRPSNAIRGTLISHGMRSVPFSTVEVNQISLQGCMPTVLHNLNGWEDHPARRLRQSLLIPVFPRRVNERSRVDDEERIFHQWSLPDWKEYYGWGNETPQYVFSIVIGLVTPTKAYQD